MFMLQLGGWFIFSLERAFGPMTVISSTWSGGAMTRATRSLIH
jgi:hypothetical protein